MHVNIGSDAFSEREAHSKQRPHNFKQDVMTAELGFLQCRNNEGLKIEDFWPVLVKLLL